MTPSNKFGECIFLCFLKTIFRNDIHRFILRSVYEKLKTKMMTQGFGMLNNTKDKIMKLHTFCTSYQQSALKFVVKETHSHNKL